MNIKLLVVGKLKEAYWKDAAKEYKKRLTPYCNLREIEIKDSSREDIVEEGEKVLEKISKEDFVITLEIEGKNLSSEDLSQKIEALGISGRSSIVFIIGGSKGLSLDVKRRSNLKLSFSKMTFTHQMARVILLEQIYRTFKIIRGENYHK